MKQEPSSRRRRNITKSILRLPDLEHAKTAVLNSLTSQDAQLGYRHAIDEFVDWYCSEPRLAFNRIVVLRYRSHLESRQLVPGAVNLRLGSVRRLARALHSPTVSCKLTVGPQQNRESQVVNGVGKKRDSHVPQTSDDFVCKFLRFSADRDRGNCGNWSITR
jgi:hypothetical protein